MTFVSFLKRCWNKCYKEELLRKFFSFFQSSISIISCVQEATSLMNRELVDLLTSSISKLHVPRNQRILKSIFENFGSRTWNMVRYLFTYVIVFVLVTMFTIATGETSFQKWSDIPWNAIFEKSKLGVFERLTFRLVYSIAVYIKQVRWST